MTANSSVFTTEIETPAMRKCGLLNDNLYFFLNDLYSQTRTCELHHNHIYIFLVPRSCEKQWESYTSQFNYDPKQELYSKDIYFKMHQHILELYDVIEPWCKGIVEIDTDSSDMEIFTSIRELIFTLLAVNAVDRANDSNIC